MRDASGENGTDAHREIERVGHAYTLGNSKPKRHTHGQLVDKTSFSAKKLLLNAAVILVGICLGVLLSIRHAYWGPEGPVGGLLLLVPYLFLAAAVTVTLIVFGNFAWVPGGRGTCSFIGFGLLILFGVSGYYSMSEVDTKYEQLAALSGWVLLAGCFVAVNAIPSKIVKTTIALTLGLGGVAGWLQMFFWLSECSSQQAQYEESRIKHEEEVQQGREAEFRALGKEAPFWNYFGFMYISNDELRKECHEIMAARADRDESLIKYLGDEILANDATRYIAEFHPAPGPALAPAFAQYSDLLVGRMSEVNSGSDQVSERSYSDIKDIIGAATRIQKGGGDLTPQLTRWRRYLTGFKNTAELVSQIDQVMPKSNGH